MGACAAARSGRQGRVRVAVVRNPAGAGIDPHVRAGVDRAADWLAQAGYDVVDAEPPISEVAAPPGSTRCGRMSAC